MAGPSNRLPRPWMLFGTIQSCTKKVPPCNERNALQNYPEIADFYAANACSIITKDMPTFLPYIGMAFVLLTVLTATAFVIYFILIRRLSTVKRHVSKRTFEMHRSLTKALILQVSIACEFSFMKSGKGLDIQVKRPPLRAVATLFQIRLGSFSSPRSSR